MTTTLTTLLRIVQVYSPAQTHAALPWGPLADAIAAAFLQGVQAPQRHVHALAGAAPGSLLLMPAWNDAVIVTKLVTVIPSATQTVQASVLVLDRAGGTPLALLDGEAVTLRRTAATSALAARHLARADADTLTLVGTGHLAPWMARAHMALRPGLKRVLVWGRRLEAAQAIAATLRAEGLAVEATPDLEAAVRSGAIVCCATTSTVPLVQGAWLGPGTHLDLVGGFRPDMREADDAAIARCRIAVDTFDGALAEAGDLVQPLRSGVLQREALDVDLAALLRGVRPRGAPAQDCTAFKSVGSAIEDLAAAQLVCRR